MKHLYTIVLTALFLLPCFTRTSGQATYPQVYQLLNAHCGTAGCHDGTDPTFNATLPPDSFYHSIINATPLNPAAAAIFNKLVVPGDVQRSFLLRKMADSISDGLKLKQPNEGAYMPKGLPALKNFEIELVRQWILYGAPDTGTVVDTALINTYYRNGGIDDTYSPHTPPAAGTGFQIYYGRVFLRPNTEGEYFLKYNPHITSPIEAKQIVTMMPTVDHHFGIWMYQPGTDALYKEGIRPLLEGSMEHVTYGIGTAAGLWDFELPTNTAFFFDQGQMFDLDLHIHNPSMDTIISVDLYANIYTQPVGTAQKYMRVNNYVDDQISIPQDGQTHTFTIVGRDAFETQYWKLWKMYTHTHKYGTAFNVWLRNPDGSKGAMVYNGNYSYEDNYDVGYYRWGPHVTFRTWAADSLFEVDPRNGFIGEASYKNTAGPDPVTWGFSSADEMLDLGFFYVYGDDLPTGINTPEKTAPQVKVFPNPIADDFVITYELTEAESVDVELFDLLGKKVCSLLHSGAQPGGKYSHTLHAADYKLQAGTYLVTLHAGANSFTQKLVITD